MSKSKSKTILFLNGPNLNMLGLRDKELYGKETLASIVRRLKDYVEARPGYALVAYQSNCSGDLITRINNAQNEGVVGIIINPGGLTHYDVGLRDSVDIARSLGIPTVEVHLSDIDEREPRRHFSVLSPKPEDGMGEWVVIKRIAGKKSEGYFEGFDVLAQRIENSG